MNNVLNKIKLICDSSIDLTKEFIQEEDIEIMPFPVTINDQTYEDGVTITVDEMYEMINKYKKLPKTSAFGPVKYDLIFKKFINYQDVIFIGLGSGFSSSLNNARICAMNYPNVHVIDSKNLSSGTGLLVMKICKMRKEGKDINTIIDSVNKLVPLVKTQFAVNTLEHLHMGGRCSGTTKLIGTMLKIKPIIKVINNAMVVSKKPIGFKKALDAMLDEVIEDKDNVDLDHIMITHSKADEDAKYVKEQLSKYFDPSVLLETNTSGTISTHCGPRTIGILYITKK